MSDAHWWRGIAPAQATVECGGAIHRLRWEAGRLAALDHDDLEAELSLVALGGEPCPCATLVDAWSRHAADSRVLVLGSRGAGDAILPAGDGNGPPTAPMAARRPARPRPRAGMGMWGVGTSRAFSVAIARGGPGPRPRSGLGPGPDGDPLEALLALGGGLDRRLQATVIAATGAPAGALAHAAIYGRLLAALGPWLGSQSLDLRLELIAADAPRRLTRDGDSVTAELPFDWLLEVWARELELVWGRFCLAARPIPTPPGADEVWELTTVAPDLGEPLPLTLTFAA